MPTNYEKLKQYYAQARKEFIKEYGGKCSCCGETEEDFLTLDHKHGGGTTSRFNSKGNRYRKSWEGYTWLKRQGWPKDGYRIMCFNCNCARAKPINFGVCPHEKKRLIAEGKWPPPRSEWQTMKPKSVPQLKPALINLSPEELQRHIDFVKKELE